MKYSNVIYSFVIFCLIFTACKNETKPSDKTKEQAEHKDSIANEDMDSDKVILVSPPIPIDEEFTDPLYPGGKDALKKYLKQNLIIPKEIKEGGGDGVVYAYLTINENGKIVKYEVLEAINYCSDCSKEAIRLIKMMPNWEPAYQLNDKGKKLNAISSHIVIEIEFKR